MADAMYRRVTAAAPCPVCGHADWCRVSADGGLVVCNRRESSRPARGNGGGWLHLIGRDADRPRPTVTTTASVPDKLPWSELVRIDRQCRADLTDARLAPLARTLGVSAASLRRLGIGWHAGRRVFTYAMRDVAGRVVGIHTRRDDGHKPCLPGSTMGLVLPAELVPLLATDSPSGEPPDVLLVCEGESDAAAALDLGYAAVARPGCTSCVGLVLVLADRLRPGRIVLIADRDRPGQDGAHGLARRLAAAGVGCRVLTLPDVKDLRAWKAMPGNDCHAIAALIDARADRAEHHP